MGPRCKRGSDGSAIRLEFVYTRSAVRLPAGYAGLAGRRRRRAPSRWRSPVLDVLEPVGVARRRTLDDPGRWLRTTSLLDLEDPKLRLRAQALTQLSKSDR